MAKQAEPTPYLNRSASAVAPGGRQASREICTCFDQIRVSKQRRVRFHSERQDTSLPAWQHFLELIDGAAADGREVFRPLVELSPQERRQIVTLPATIGKLKEVREFVLYGSNLVRVPPEIGAMTSLENFDPYTSHRLHWFPYELAWCPKLKASRVSTRSLYGNYKLRPPFPPLQPDRTPADDLGLDMVDPGVWGADVIRTCSVCDQPISAAGVHQAWISLQVATDVLPLLVNACSTACLSSLPAAAEGYVSAPHTGGPGIVQPSTRYA